MSTAKELVENARNLGFDVYDFVVIDGVECVAKKHPNGEFFHWGIVMEGEKFESLFKGFSKRYSFYSPE